MLDANNIVVSGVHITRLLEDGTGKASDAEGRSKVMVGPSMGLPIVLAPVSDSGGLVITEGVEDGLSLAPGVGRRDVGRR